VRLCVDLVFVLCIPVVAIVVFSYFSQEKDRNEGASCFLVILLIFSQEKDRNEGAALEG
jgi:hypothetical protein